MPTPDPSSKPGRVSPERVVSLAVAVTAIHLAASVLGLQDTSTALAISGVVNVALFGVGIILFVAAFLVAAGRSRTEDLWFGGVFFLTGDVAPTNHRVVLLACVATQTIVGLAVAGLAPFTAAAFAVLVPLLGLAILAWYGSRFGRFSVKAEAQ
ncbi:MAG: hypothetical protein ACI8TP_002505 [Acidimicrobiales bacterium]|jgi:hypothetical protein